MKKVNRVFWGLSLIAVAVVIILSQMGFIDAVLSPAKIILGVLYLAILVSAVTSKSFGGVFLALGLSWVTFGPVIGLPYVSIWMVILIVVLLTSGFNFIFPKKFHNMHEHNWHDYDSGKHGDGDAKWDDYEAEDKVGEHQTVVDSDRDGYIECTNKMGALAKYVKTNDFKGADITNSFGELKVYFDEAIIIHSPVDIRVNNSFGSLKLYIPKTWNVITDISVFAGACQEDNKPGSVNDVTVNLIGSDSFGEIKILYV